MLNLKSVLYAVTPENIRSIPLVKVSLDIFVDYLMQSNELSQRISAVFDVDTLDTATAAQKKSRAILRKGAYYTWIYTLYHTLERLAVNTDVLNAIEKDKFSNASLTKGLDKILTPEIINTSRVFSQKVGTPSALKYMYYFGKYLETGNYSLDLEINEGNPFIIHYKGSMSPAMFNNIVKPMAHPIGWIDSYEHILSLIFHDYFGIVIDTAYDRIEFNNNAKWVVFITDNDRERIYKEFTKERINPETGKFYTRSEAEKYVEIFTNKVTSSFDQTINDDGTIDRTIVFSDQTVLLQQGKSPRWIKYTTYEDYVDGVKNPTRQWGEDWVFFGSLTTNFKFLYTDEMNEFTSEYDFDGLDDFGRPDKKYEYITVEPNNCFKIGGQEYPYLYGNDEHQFVVENKQEVQEIIKRNFSTSFQYRVFRSSYITISDDFDHRYEYYIDYPNPDRSKIGIIELSTIGLQGFDYTVDIKEISGTHYWYKVTGLNQYNPRVEFNRVFTEQYILRVWGSVKLTDNKFNEVHVMNLVLTDSKGKTASKQVTEDGNWFFELPIKGMAPGEFKIELSVVNPKGRVRYKATYQGCDLWAYNDIEPWVTFLKYNSREAIPPIEHKPLEHILQLSGSMSTADYVKTRIGQLYSGDYAEPDARVQDWIDPDYPRSPWEIEELDDKIIRGAYIEGSNINKCYWYSDDYWDEETFIYKGFAHKEISNPDYIIMDAQKYAWDDFDIELISAHNGYYLFTDIDYSQNDYRGKYLYTNDSCYLFSKEWYIKIFLEANNQENYRVHIIDKRLRWKQIKPQLPVPKKARYTFLHWSLSRLGQEIDDNYSFTDDATLWAVWLENPTEVTIRFETQGGNYVAPIVLKNDVDTPWSDIMHKVPEPRKHGWDFVHWSLTPNGDAVDVYHIFAKNTVVYAVWTIHHYEYRIRLEEQGGSQIPDIIVKDNVPFSEFSKLIFPPYRSGYNFMYWSLTEAGVPVDPSWMATEPTTMWAIWSEVEQVKLVFDSMGGSYVAPIKINPMQRQVLPIPKLSGKTFLHWSSEPHGLEVDFRELSGTKKLYAVWI